MWVALCGLLSLLSACGPSTVSTQLPSPKIEASDKDEPGAQRVLGAWQEIWNGLEKGPAGAFATRGHLPGRYQALMRATSFDAYRRADVAAEGFIVCEKLRELRDGADGPLLCMKRQGQGWHYAAVTGGPASAVREGALPDCVLCHDAAPRAGLFGPP